MAGEGPGVRPDPDELAAIKARQRAAALKEATERAASFRQALADDFNVIRGHIGDLRFSEIVYSVGGYIEADGAHLTGDQTQNAIILLQRLMSDIIEARDNIRDRERLRREAEDRHWRMDRNAAECDKAERDMKTYA